MTDPMIVTLKEVLKKREIQLKFVPPPEYITQLMAECELMEVSHIYAFFKIYPIAKNKGIGVEADIHARVVQPCVITLGPVPQKIHEKAFLRFTPNAEVGEIDVVYDDIYFSKDIDDFDTEKLVNDEINLYDIMREYIVLALDPMPRVANAEFKGYTAGELTDEERKFINKNIERVTAGETPVNINNPFSALADLKKRTSVES